MADSLGFSPYQRRPLDIESTFGQLVGATVRQGNDLYNLYDYATRPVFDVDPNFDSIAYGKDNPLWGNYSGELAVAQSEEEFRDIAARITQREQDLAILADRGWQGFATMAVSGLVSPTTLIPFVGGARGVRGVAQAVALAGAASTLQELPIALNQIGETTEETLVNIAAGTVLGGLLGSAAVFLRPQARALAEAELRSDVPLTARATAGLDETGRLRVEGEWQEINIPRPRGPHIEPERPFTPSDIFISDRAQRSYTTRSSDALDLEAPEPGYVRFFYEPESRKLVPPDARALRSVAEAKEFGANYIDLPVGHPVERAARAFTDEDVANNSSRVGRYTPIDPPLKLAEGFRRTLGETYTNIYAPTRRGMSGAQVREQPQAAPRAPEEPPTPANAATAPEAFSQSIGAAATMERFIPEDAPAGLSGRSAGELSGAGARNPASRALRTAAKVSPIARLVSQDGLGKWKSETLRSFAQVLDDTGLTYQGNRFGIATAEGGSVMARKGWYTARAWEAMYGQYESYLRYLYDGEPVRLTQRSLNYILSLGYRRAPKGKMNFREFKEAVADKLNVPGTPTNKYVAEAAKVIRERLFNAINQQMLDATDQRGTRALYNIREGDEEWGYFSHIFAPEKIVANQEAFVKDVADHYEAITTAYYTRKLAKLRRFAAETEAVEALQNLDRATAVEEITRITEALRAMKNPEALEDKILAAQRLEDEARRLEDMKNDQGVYDEDFADWYAETFGDDVEGVDDYIKELRDQAEALYAEIPERAFEEKKVLQTQLRALRRSFGAYEEKQAKLLQRIEDNEEMNLRALDRVDRAVRKFLKELPQLDDAKLDAELAKLVKDLDRQEELIFKGRKRLEKLAEGDIEKFSIESGRQLTRDLKRLRLERRVGDARAVDRQLARDMLAAKLEDTKRTVNRLNEARSRRNQRMLTEAEKYNPENVSRLIEDRRARLGKMSEDLEAQVRAGGDPNFHVRSGELNFRETAEEMAREVMAKIIGNYTRIGQLDALPGLRGPMKNRVLNLPYSVKKKWLELDTEKVIARYSETMGSDIELFRAYGSVNGSTAMRAIKDDFERIKERIARSIEDPEKRARELQKFDAASKGYFDTFDALLMRARGLWGIQNMKGHIGQRLGRFMLNWNVATMMGTVTISSVSDVHRSITAYGLMRTLRTSWVPLLKSLVDSSYQKLSREQIKQLKLMGIGVETFSHARARGTFELLPEDPYMTRGERAMESMSASMPMVAAFGFWTDAMKLITGIASMTTFVETLPRLIAGKARRDEIEWMASMGINDVLARQIWDEMQNGGASEVAGTLVPNTSAWRDRAAARAFEAAMFRESERLIISPGMEKPLFMDGSMAGRLISQFRSFTMSSHTKALVALGQVHDRHTAMKAFTGFTTSMALGALSYWLWAMSSGEDAIDEMRNASWGQWIDQALARGGYLGVLSEVQNIGGTVPWLADYTTFGGEAIAGRRADDFMAAIAGPSFGKVQDFSQVLLGLDEPTEGTVNQARKLVPYQNVFYLKQIFEKIEQGVNNLFNLPERRSR